MVLRGYTKSIRGGFKKGGMKWPICHDQKDWCSSQIEAEEIIENLMLPVLKAQWIKRLLQIWWLADTVLIFKDTDDLTKQLINETNLSIILGIIHLNWAYIDTLKEVLQVAHQQNKHHDVQMQIFQEERYLSITFPIMPAVYTWFKTPMDVGHSTILDTISDSYI